MFRISSAPYDHVLISQTCVSNSSNMTSSPNFNSVFSRSMKNKRNSEDSTRDLVYLTSVAASLQDRLNLKCSEYVNFSLREGA